MKLFLKNEIAKNKMTISNEAYFAYIVICLANKLNEKECLITSTSFLYDIGKIKEDEKPRKYVKWIAKGIEDLENLKYIVVKNKLPKGYIVDTSKLIARDQLSDNSFTVIDSCKVRQIFNINNSQHFIHSVCLLRSYHCIISTVYNSNKKEDENKNGVGFMPVTRIAKDFDYTFTQFSDYIKELENEKVIYFKRSSNILISTEKKEDNPFFKERYVIIPGVYGNYENKDKIFEYGVSNENQYIEKMMKNENFKISGLSNRANSTRSIKQKRNRIAKLLSEGSQNPYSYEECKYIYYQMIEINNTKKGKFVSAEDYDIFKVFDFYNEDEIVFVEKRDSDESEEGGKCVDSDDNFNNFELDIEVDEEYDNDDGNLWD